MKSPCSEKWARICNPSIPVAAGWQARSVSRRKNTMCRKPWANACFLPAVRNTPENALIVSDGFSCREQILQSTGRRAIHLAEALQLGMKNK